MITYRDVPGTNIAELLVDGKVCREDFDAVIPKMEKLIGEYGKVRFLEEIRSFGGVELGVLWDDMKFAFGHLKDFERVAVVTDKRWIKNWSKLGTIFLKADVEVFDLDELEKAREWLREKENAETR